MKKINLVLAVLAFFAAASCSHEEYNSIIDKETAGPADVLVPLSLSTGEMTKTSLAGGSVNWTADDEIAVFDIVNYANIFSATSVAGSSAVFEGFVGEGTTDFYAVYPYTLAKSADASSIIVTLPAGQTSADGTFAEEHNISVAHGVKTVGEESVDGINFKNVCGLIQFTVPQRIAAVKSVSFKAENRGLAGDLSISKSDLKVTEVANGSNTVKMTGDFAAGSTFYFVVAPGEVNGFSITVTAQNGATYSKTSAKSFTVEAGAMKNLGVIDFKAEPAAVAEHIYENGVLSGTKVTLTLGVPAGMEAYVENLTASMTKDGVEYRSISKTSAAASEVMAIANGKTYVPQGDYAIEYTYTLNGVAETKTVNVTVPAPEFTVSASAYTSYSKYLEGDVTAANSCAPESMYDIKCSVSISDDVLNQLEMSSCAVTLKQPSGSEISLSGSANKKASTYLSTSQYNVSEWGAYTLSSVVTFDGVTKSCPPKTLHITGLPFNTPQFKDSGIGAWSVVTEGTGHYITFGGSVLLKTDGTPASVSTPKFHVPAGIDVSLYNKYSKNTGSLFNYEYSVNLYNGESEGTSLISHESNDKGTYEFNVNTQLTSEYNAMLCKYSYRALGNDVTINEFDISYR